MKKLVFIFLFFSQQVFGQITFQKGYSQNIASVTDVIQTADSGYTLLGNHAGDWIEVIKTNKYGDTIWTKSFKHVYSQTGEKMIRTLDKGYMICGTNTGINGSNSQVLLIKLDSVGNLLWSMVPSTGQGVSVVQCSDSGYVVLLYGPNLSNSECALLKIDPNGNFLWAKKFNSNTTYFSSLDYTNDNGFILTGQKFWFSVLDDAVVVRTDSIGNVLWSKVYGDTAIYEQGICISPTSDGGFVMVGNIFSWVNWPQTGEQLLFIKTDSSGAIQWSKKYGSDTIPGFYRATSVEETSDAGFIISGYAQFVNNANTLYKTDSVGNLLWANEFTDTVEYSRGTCAHQTFDSGYVVVGLGEGFVWNTGPTFHLIKTDANGISGCHEQNIALPVNPISLFTQNGSYATSNFIPSTSAINLTVGSVGLVYDACLQTTYVIELSNTQFSVSLSPNPTSAIFTVTSEQEITAIEIYNVLGEQVFHQQIITSSNLQINLTSQPKGIYFCTIITQNGSATRKIVIQ